MAEMRIVFITQAVDLNHPVQAFAVRWIEVMANHADVESIEVLTLKEGSYKLPKNVTIRLIKGCNRYETLRNFYRFAWVNAVDKKTIFFVHQNGVYPILLLLQGLIRYRPVYQWLCHSHRGWKTEFNTRFATTGVFTATNQSHPLKMSHVHVVGHGINMGKFSKNTVYNKNCDILVLGRITPVKRIDLIIDAVASAREELDIHPRVHIYGEAINSLDEKYLVDLQAQAAERGVNDLVFFKGGAVQDDIPRIIAKAKAMAFCCQGALGKVVIEAMAVGLPVVTTNPCAAEALPEELRDVLYCKTAQPREIANCLGKIMTISAGEYQRMGDVLAETARADHCDIQLFDRIVSRIKTDLS